MKPSILLVGILSLVLAVCLWAQSFTTTCNPSTLNCIITVLSGTVTIANPTPAPTVSMTRPVTGATVIGPVDLTVVVSAGVTNVAFLMDGNIALGQVTAAPWTLTVNSVGVPNGTHALTARATQGLLSSTSSPVSITIKNPVIPLGPPLTDTFKTTILNPLWTFMNPVADASYASSAAGLKLNVPAGQNHDPAFGGANNSVRVRQPIANADFSVITQFDSIPSVSYQTEGVAVDQDAKNYLRFQFASDGTTLSAYANTVAGGADTNNVSANITKGSATSIWMAVAKSGANWTMSYSLDGKTFVPVGTFTSTFAANYIGPMAGNYANVSTTAPAFPAIVNNFTNAPVPAPPPPPPAVIACTSTPTGVVNIPAGTFDIQGLLNTAVTGNNVVFGAGTSSVAATLKFKAGVSYCGPASGVAVLQGAGGYPNIALAGNNITIAGLTLIAGGIEITGSADKLLIQRNIIRDIQSTAATSGAIITGIYQDRGNGLQLSNSLIDHNQLLNIYAPGQLTCDGTFPSGGGQPCDWYHDGMDFYNVSNVSFTYNTLDTIAGDAIHFFQDISCGQMGGPKLSQPNINFSNNIISNNHRIPYEQQLCGLVNPTIANNYILKTFIPNAWDIGISFASESTGARITGNYIDGASGQGPGWGIPGTIFETGGTGTVVDGNFATNGPAPGGTNYYTNLSSVMGSNAVFTNNKLCGPFSTTLVIWEPPCNTGGCGAFKQSGNTVAASCAGFPAPPVNVGALYTPPSTVRWFPGRGGKRK